MIWRKKDMLALETAGGEVFYMTYEPPKHGSPIALVHVPGIGAITLDALQSYGKVTLPQETVTS